jgi:hypothetical protein
MDERDWTGRIVGISRSKLGNEGFAAMASCEGEEQNEMDGVGV